jgi:hypothetical protein
MDLFDNTGNILLIASLVVESGIMDLFDNFVSCLTSLAFFRAKAGFSSAKTRF